MKGILVATSPKNVIGKDNTIPWHYSEDLKRFKRLTIGKTVIMGRKTWDSLYVKPLPSRRNIVVTRNPDFQANSAETAFSMKEALSRVADAEEAVVIGGATLFADALPAAGRFHLTEVHAEIDGDTFFPNFDRDHWREISRDHHPADGDNPAYSFVLLERT